MILKMILYYSHTVLIRHLNKEAFFPLATAQGGTQLLSDIGGAAHMVVGFSPEIPYINACFNLDSGKWVAFYNFCHN